MCCQRRIRWWLGVGLGVLAMALGLPLSAAAQDDDYAVPSVFDDSRGETDGANSAPEGDAPLDDEHDDVAQDDDGFGDGVFGDGESGGDDGLEDDGSLFGEPEPSPFVVRLSIGAGFGIRSLDLPRDRLVYEVRTGLAPALEAAFALEYAAGGPWTFALLTRYQTTVGMVLVERRTDSSEQRRDTRASRLEVGVTTTLRFGDGPLGVAAALGYAISDLRPRGHLLTPAYHLGGPFGRLELVAEIVAERLRLRVGPEAHMIMQVGQELVDNTDLQGTADGLGFGGEAVVEYVLAPFALGLSYREIHRSVSAGAADAEVKDVSRFATFRLTGEL